MHLNEYEEGPNHKRRDSAEAEAGRSVGDGEEETGGVERKITSPVYIIYMK